MLEYMPYVWAGVTILAIWLESLTADLITIWFIPAGLISVIISLLPVKIDIWIQVSIFFAISFVLIIFSKTIFKNFFKKKPVVATNLDTVIGKEAVVIEAINNLEGKGAVKVLGKEWSAITYDNSEIIQKNSLVIVKEIRGVKLVCIQKIDQAIDQKINQ